MTDNPVLFENFSFKYKAYVLAGLLGGWGINSPFMTVKFLSFESNTVLVIGAAFSIAAVFLTVFVN